MLFKGFGDDAENPTKRSIHSTRLLQINAPPGDGEQRFRSWQPELEVVPPGCSPVELQSHIIGIDIGFSIGISSVSVA